MTRIAVLHPGAMGAAVGAALVGAGHEVGWLPEGRGRATAERAAAAGLVPWQDLTGVELVVSLVPPAAALPAARELPGFDGLYLDANAIGPARAAEVAALVHEAGATYIDGSVIGPPPAAAGTTRLYLSGAAATRTARVFAGSIVEPIVLEGGFSASAMKMGYASVTKIGDALVLAAFELAQASGVDDALLQEWHRSQPAFAAQLAQARAHATAKGWRWGDEMRQIAATLAEAGLPAGFGEAAAEIFDRYPRP
ncbi:MAG: DUF1932 domain-containing protein [Microbacterium sp.]|uniref:DUF1932 domain-containing protein n=1 Tax=Microbacterium sp. TaxID=51671 RepID=UPI0039E673C1